MKTIFITGASSGLGKATALLFAKHGWDVIATMRQPEKEKDLLGNERIRLEKLDVTDTEQISKTIAAVIESTDVDVVFNNAGHGMVGPLEAVSDEQLNEVMNTNLLGVIRVTKAFIPYFREKKKGLFISTTSIGGLVTFPFNSLYHAGKWALEGWSESLAFELSLFNIGIKTVSPGAIKTDFMGRSMVFSPHPAYQGAIDNVIKTFTESGQEPATSEQIAQVVYEAATDGSNKLRYVAGTDAKALYAERNKVGDEAFRKSIQQRYMG